MYVSARAVVAVDDDKRGRSSVVVLAFGMVPNMALF